MERFIVNLSSDSNEYMTVYKVSKNHRSIREGEVKRLTNSDINEAVYAAMKVAGQEVVDRCQVYLSGERTASELAGKAGKYISAVDPDIHEKHVNVPKSIQISVGDIFSCCISTGELFQMMADWEGMMGMKAKDCHRFYCQCDAKADRSKEVTPYKRSVYTAGRVSIAAENQRIYNKFKALLPLTQSLTSEGMRKCLSCLTAIEAAKKKYGASHRGIRHAMLWKLWDDYHKDDYYQPKDFCAKDFKEAPEIWKQVDDAYVKELLDYFDALVRKAPQPEWARKDAFVMFANQDTTPKKWKGKLRVRAIYTTYYRTSTIYNDEKSVGWVVEMCTTKGRYDTLTHSVRFIKPWEDEKKPKPKKKGVERLKEIAKPETEEERKAAIKREKSDARIGSSEREQARHDSGKPEPKPAVKTEYTPEFLANVLRETLIKLVA